MVVITDVISGIKTTYESSPVVVTKNVGTNHESRVIVFSPVES